MRIYGRRSRLSRHLTPVIGSEIKNMKLVSIGHKLINSSKHIHLFIIKKRRLRMPPSGQLSFLLDFFPLIRFKRKAEEVVEYVGLVIVVAAVDV